MSYEPHPTDIDGIELSEELKRDVEALARDVHERWAAERIKRGWGYGSVYNSDEKKHPCLTNYENLSEKEKDMDRATVLQTIKMLLHMGYRIEKEV